MCAAGGARCPGRRLGRSRRAAGGYRGRLPPLRAVRITQWWSRGRRAGDGGRDPAAAPPVPGADKVPRARPTAALAPLAVLIGIRSRCEPRAPGESAGTAEGRAGRGRGGGGSPCGVSPHRVGVPLPWRVSPRHLCAPSPRG